MLAFIDETGDHNLIKIDDQYPVFGLGALIIEEEEYRKLDKAILDFKARYFENPETMILHALELKRPNHKKSDPRNKIMIDAGLRKRFYSDFDENIVQSFKYKLVFCFIRKVLMSENYSYPIDPYYFSFENVLNRIMRHGGVKNHIYAEKRGEELDVALEAEYDRLKKVGIRFYTNSEVVQNTEMTLIDKKENINGLQFIDLALSSIIRCAMGKQEKMIGNDCDPTSLKKNLACPMTFFPYKR